ncbi:MAG: hypothetical protein A2W85_15020 [Bacteroidetes bacterium GWF2_41_31]|nr:MAG: hypothetical protein A2W85_15020 [Bacteroidetes bacterium GWF2_41_31]
MKKLLLNVLLVVAGTIFSHNLFAQYPIPSFNVPVIIDPTIFEEINPSSGTTFNNLGFSFGQPGSREEKKLKIEIKDQSILTSAWASIEVYSLSGNLIYGPFSIYEGVPFELAVSTAELWGIRVLNASEECQMDVWFE